MASTRQRIAAQKLSEIIRNSKQYKKMSMGKILFEAGYSKQTSLKPKLVTESKGFKEIFGQYITDIDLVKTTSSLLNSSELKRFAFEPGISEQVINSIFQDIPNHKVLNITEDARSKRLICYYLCPNNSVTERVLDMICKIKGYYKTETSSNQNEINVKIVEY